MAKRDSKLVSSMLVRMHSLPHVCMNCYAAKRKESHVKNVFALFLFLFCAQGAHADAEFPQDVETLSDELTPFVYESRAQIPTSDEKLAEMLSSDYRNAPDEFAKHDLMQRIQPILKTRLADAKKRNEYSIRINTQLGQYDFNSKSFPSGFSETTFIPFNGNKYGVMFDNVRAIQNIPVPLENARTLSSKLQGNRRVTAVVYCRITGTQEKKVYMLYDTKFLKASITKAVFLSDGDEPIATLTPSQPK